MKKGRAVPAGGNNMKLKLQDISKSYGKTVALQNFSAEMTPGIYALLGPNGSGKSTLMNVITDNLKADSGRILYTGENGETEETLKMGERFREKLGFMPQYPGLYPNFTVRDLLLYMVQLKGFDRNFPKEERRAQTLAAIDNVLRAVELEDVALRKISALSGGMKQRLALAQAVLGNPEILILDEPTAGLDPKQRIAIRNFITSIALNRIVLLATHVVSDVEWIASRIIVLKKGSILANCTPSELISQVEGAVWEVSVDEGQISQWQERLRVVNMVRDDQNPSLVKLRVLSQERPAQHARPLSPSLEDAYLFLVGTA